MASRSLSLLGFLPLGRDLILTHSQLINGFAEQRVGGAGGGGVCVCVCVCLICVDDVLSFLKLGLLC